MIEVRWHGRGGQGAFTAARLLGAAAALYDHRHALAFPSFGPERRGAPVLAFTRIDERPVQDRSPVRGCDWVVVLDDTLMTPAVVRGLRAGAVLVNTSSKAEQWSDLGVRVLTVDATQRSTEVLGRPIVNTAMLAALVAVSGVVTKDAMLEALASELRGRIAEKNGELARQVYEEVSHA
jgi:pyruvate ferredoxin oxidoreductase gamma subunit